MKHIAELKDNAGLLRGKGFLDYNCLLRACYATEAPYIVLFEDYIVAMDGRNHRALTELEQAEIEPTLQNWT